MSGIGYMLGSNTHVSNMALRGATGVSGDAAWTPAEITTALWLDADDADTITEATGVSQWDDKSGNNRDVTQGTGSKQPAYNSTTKKVVFDGSDDYMSVNFGATLTQPNSVFAVSKFNSLSILNKFLYDGIDASNRHSLFLRNADNTFAMYGGALLSSKAEDTVEHVISSVFNSTSSTQYFDGTLTDSGDAGTQSLTGLILGMRYDLASANYSDMNLSEVVVVNSAVDTNTRQKIEGYLAHKWGLEANLPAGHPYKSAAPTI